MWSPGLVASSRTDSEIGRGPAAWAEEATGEQRPGDGKTARDPPRPAGRRGPGGGASGRMGAVMGPVGGSERALVLIEEVQACHAPAHHQTTGHSHAVFPPHSLPSQNPCRFAPASPKQLESKRGKKRNTELTWVPRGRFSEVEMLTLTCWATEKPRSPVGCWMRPV